MQSDFGAVTALGTGPRLIREFSRCQHPSSEEKNLSFVRTAMTSTAGTYRDMSNDSRGAILLYQKNSDSLSPFQLGKTIVLGVLGQDVCPSILDEIQFCWKSSYWLDD